MLTANSISTFACSALLTSLGKTRALIPATVIVVVADIILNYLFIFGKFGCPALGMRGAAVGSIGAELVTAIQEVLRGRTYVTPLVTKDMMESFLDPSEQPERLHSRLTPRQREVLQLVAEGHSNKEIAAVLKVSTKTVEFHKYNLMEALGIRTTAELTQYAMRHGYISD